MTPFTTLTSIAAPLPEADIDTDVIFPARFLLLAEKNGLGGKLFFDRRFDESGAPKNTFILDCPPFNSARILVTGANFGSGSSREHAVWALADFGIRCVIAPSFGEIFYSNCIKNGVLPVRLPTPEHASLLERTRSEPVRITVDLRKRQIHSIGATVSFAIAPAHRRALLGGLDEIGEILANDLPDISNFEARQRVDSPWLMLPDPRAR